MATATAQQARQNRLPQPEPPSLAEPEDPQVGALKSAMEDLYQKNEDLAAALESARASLANSLPEAPASMNFYAVTAKGYNLQYTLRDSDDDRLLTRFRALMGKMEDLKIQPKPVGQQPAQTAPAQAGSNGNAPASSSGPYEWKMKNGALEISRGKMTLLIRGDASEPNEIACPQHAGKTLKRRANDDGSWLSHKQGESFCSASFQSA